MKEYSQSRSYLHASDVQNVKYGVTSCICLALSNNILTISLWFKIVISENETKHYVFYFQSDFRYLP